jgi:hypothetical protein
LKPHGDEQFRPPAWGTVAAVAGKTRRRIAAEELADPVAVDAKMKKSTAELKVLVTSRGSRLMDLHGVGPVVAARTHRRYDCLSRHGSPPDQRPRPSPVDDWGCRRESRGASLSGRTDR